MDTNTSNTSGAESVQEFHQAQRDYVMEQEHRGQAEYAATNDGAGLGLVDDAMLALNMRSTRYVDEAHASADLIDNAIEAGATQVHVAFKTSKNGTIQAVAHLDDGCGILKEFLRHSVRWGASSRQGRRNTFGRFGNALSSASVKFGKVFNVFSRTDTDTTFQVVGLDMDDLPKDEGGNVCPPEISEQALPTWVVEYCQEHFEGGVAELKTAVVWETLDRPKWKKIQVASYNYKDHLGVTYAGWLGVSKLYVQGELVEPVDVLFTTPGHRYYDIDAAPRAEPLTSQVIPIADENGVRHDVTLRVSKLSADAVDAAVSTGSRGAPPKVRQKIRAAYNGVFVTRNGRFIELATPKDLFGAWNNYMRQVAIHLDFPPALDDIFGITPDKQTIVWDERVNSAIEASGVVATAREAYREIDQARHEARQARELAKFTEGDRRPSEVVIDKVVNIDPRRGVKTKPDETVEEAEKELIREVKETAAATGMTEGEIRESLEKRLAERPFVVQLTPGTADGSFYIVRQVGEQSRLEINSGHPFYTEMFSRISDAETLSAIETMLWVIGMAELDASGERRAFYLNERSEWSRRLAVALNLHPQIFHRAASLTAAREDSNDGWDTDDDEHLETQAKVTG